MRQEITMADELLDIVNENDLVIGQEWRSTVYAHKQNNFRVINAFLINTRGQLWIPRRTHFKQLFPLALDASVGGHVMAGEIYEHALIRETQEELGIHLSSTDYYFKGKLNPSQHAVSAFMYVYIIPTDTVPPYNRHDFCDFFWLTPAELLERLEQGELAKGDLAKIVRYLLI
jgi:isopentenyl-diphosphate delta-isomerase